MATVPQHIGTTSNIKQQLTTRLNRYSTLVRLLLSSLQHLTTPAAHTSLPTSSTLAITGTVPLPPMLQLDQPQQPPAVHDKHHIVASRHKIKNEQHCNDSCNGDSSSSGSSSVVVVVGGTDLITETSGMSHIEQEEEKALEALIKTLKPTTSPLEILHVVLRADQSLQRAVARCMTCLLHRSHVAFEPWLGVSAYNQH
jgi:hypothetical protein